MNKYPVTLVDVTSFIEKGIGKAKNGCPAWHYSMNFPVAEQSLIVIGERNELMRKNTADNALNVSTLFGALAVLVFSIYWSS